MKKFLMMGILTWSAIMVASDEETAAFARASGAKMRLDTRTGTRIAAIGAEETITYSPRWSDVASCAVTADGAVLKTASEEGDVRWSPDSTGAHTLTHTAGDETLTAQFTVLGDDVAQHAGSLTASETWGSNQVHLVTADFSVPSGKTLTIEPGAVVKFMTGTALTVDGTCTAKGVIFTHVNDDTAGGDTLLDGDAAKPVMDGYRITGNIYEDDATERRYETPQTLTSSVSGTVTLKGHRVYLANSSVTVNSGATLILRPGAIIKFASGCSMTVNGTLDAQGTRAAPIVFTSQKDDTWGGDTNGDGEKTYAQAGDWHQITGSGTVKMNYCQVLWCSAQNNQGGLYPRGGAWTFDNSIVAHCQYDCMRGAGGNFNANNSVFMDSSMGAAPQSGMSRFVNCVFYYLTTAVRWGAGSYYNCIFAEIAEDIIDTKFYSSTVNSPFGHCCFWAPNATGDKAGAKVGKDGNIWADPKFVDPDNGDFRIAADSPCVDAGDGTVAPEVDYYGQPRMDAKGKAATGVPNSDGVCPDIGIYEYPGKVAAPVADLVVLSVTAPSVAKIGEEMTLSYVVTNCGGATVSGAWRDVVSFLSGETSVAAEPVVTAGEIVAGGEAVTFTETIRVPAIQEGVWTIKVDVNAYRDVFESVVEDNNVTTAKTVTAVSMSAAGLDGEQSGTVAFDRPYVVKFIVPDEEDYVAFISAPSGAEVAYGVGYMPQGAIGGGALVGSGAYVSLPAGRTVYIQVTSGQSGEVKVTTRKAGLTVQSVSPGSFPQSGRVTAAVSGLHFASGAMVELVSGTKRIVAESVRMVSSERLQAEFDCAKLAAGTSYALVVTQGEKKAELANAVTVQGVAGAAKLTARLDMPNALRQGRSFVFYIEYGNMGNLDLPVPVFTVISDQMIFDTGTGKYDGSVKVLGLGAPGSEGVIRPGESFRLAVKAQVKTSTASRSSVSYSLKATYAGARGTEEKLPLATFFSDEYAYWTEDATQIAERKAVAAKMGATWSDFYTNLGGYLTALGKYGLATSDYEAMAQEFAEHCVTEVREQEKFAALMKASVASLKLATANNAVPLSDNLGVSPVLANGEEVLLTLPTLEGDWPIPYSAFELRTRTQEHNDLLKNMDNSNSGDVWLWNGAGWYRLYQPTNGHVSAYFKKSLPSVVICHGNLHSVHSKWVREMAAAWKDAESCNVLAVDWGDDATALGDDDAHWKILTMSCVLSGHPFAALGSGLVDYFTQHPETAVATAVDIPKVSNLAYENLSRAGVNPSELTIVGHSHGGHVAGNIAGRFGKVKRLVGLETSNFSSHALVAGSEKFDASWSKDNAEVCEFYKTSYWMSMGSFATDPAKQVFGHYNFVVIPQKDGRLTSKPAYFEHQWALGGGMSYLANIDADNAEGRLEAWRHDNVEDWFIETITDQEKWKGLGFNWNKKSCEQFGLPSKLPEYTYHGVINRCPGHEGLELARPKDWNGEWMYEDQILNGRDPDVMTYGALDRLQENVTQTIEYQYVGNPSVPDRIDEGSHKITFDVRNGANNFCINYEDVARKGKKSLNEADAPWEKNLGYGVWLCRESAEPGSLPPESDRSIVRLKDTCLFRRIKKADIKDIGSFVRPEQQTTKQLSLSIPEKFFDHVIDDKDGEDFLLVIGSGVSLKTEQPADYYGDLCPSNNWFVKKVRVKPTTLQAVVGLNGNDYEDGDVANILIGRDQTSVSFDVAAVEPGKDARNYQWVSAPDPSFGDEHAKTTKWNVKVPASEDSYLTAVTLTVSDDKGKDRSAMVLVRITRKTKGDDGDGYGGGSVSVPQSCDPNEMLGPVGAGDSESERFVRPGDWMTYTIFFENKADAEAPAQFVTVENELSEYLDWTSFEMLDVGFGTQIDMGLEGLQNGISEVEMEGTNLSVRTEVELDTDKGVAVWFMRIVSPYGDSEGWPYADDPTGFLPPNDPETHCGEGRISYRIRVREDAPNGIRIDNSATIVFDYNDPIETDPAWWNKVDYRTSNYADLVKSIEQASEDVTITLDGEIEVPEGDALNIPEGKSVTFVGDGKVSGAVTNNGELVVGEKVKLDYVVLPSGKRVAISKEKPLVDGAEIQVVTEETLECGSSVTISAEGATQEDAQYFRSKEYGDSEDAVDGAKAFYEDGALVLRRRGESAEYPWNVGAPGAESATVAWQDGDALYVAPARGTASVASLVEVVNLVGEELPLKVVSADGTRTNDVVMVLGDDGVPYESLEEALVVNPQPRTVRLFDTMGANVVFNAMGGLHTSGSEVATNFCAACYAFPEVVRNGYTLVGWFDGWKAGAYEVTEGQDLVSYEPHTLYAVWAANAPVPNGGELSLPDVVNGVANTAIGDKAYVNNLAIRNLTTPLYLTSIGQRAFMGCTALRKVWITSARSYDDLAPVAIAIGANAFSGCSELEEVYIAAEVGSIGQSAFQNCPKVKRIVFVGDGAIGYGASAFYRCGYQNGTGELKVYMSSEFQEANAGLVSDFRKWNTQLQVVEKVDILPVVGRIDIGELNLEKFSQERKLAVVVKTMVQGRPDADDVEVEYSSDLANWSPLAGEKCGNIDGTVLVEVTVPDGAKGYLRAVVK